VDTLVHVTPPNLLVFNLRGRSRFEPSDCLISPESVSFLRRVLLDRQGNRRGTEALPRRIFLARRGRRRAYNQDEVFAVFEREGFVKIYPEDHGLAEQADIFSNADMVAGPSGAAWANLVFCRRGAMGICWVDQIVAAVGMFSTLAHVVGFNLRYVTYSSLLRNASDFYSAPYVVDVNAVARELDMMLSCGGDRRNPRTERSGRVASSLFNDGI